MCPGNLIVLDSSLFFINVIMQHQLILLRYVFLVFLGRNCMLIIRLHLRSAGKAKLESRGTPVESPRSTIKRMTVTFDYHVLPPKIKTSDYRVTESVINVLPSASELLSVRTMTSILHYFFHMSHLVCFVVKRSQFITCSLSV